MRTNGLMVVLVVLLLATAGCGRMDGAGAVPVAGGFSALSALALDQWGHLYVAEAGTGRVLMLDRDGSRTVLCEGIDAPAGLACDGQGRVHVLCRARGEVLRLAPTGEREVVLSGLSGPCGLFSGRDGALLVLDGGRSRLLGIEADGQVRVLADWSVPATPLRGRAPYDAVLNDPMPSANILGVAALLAAGRVGPALAVGPGDAVYASAAGGDQIVRFGHGGRRRVDLRGLSRVTGMACDRDGGIFICTGQGAVWRLPAPWGA